MDNHNLTHFHKTVHGRLVTIAFAHKRFNDSDLYHLYAGMAIQNPIDQPNKELGEKIAYSRLVSNKPSDSKVGYVGSFQKTMYFNKYVLEHMANTIFIQFENNPKRFIANFKK